MVKWRFIDDMLYCPSCHHGKEPHYRVTTGKPMPCIGCAGKFWDPLQDKITGNDGDERGVFCECRYTLHKDQ